MGKPSAPPPPDYTPIAMAAQSNATTAAANDKIQQQQADQNYEMANKQLDTYNQRADQAFKLSTDQFNWAQRAYDDNKSQNQQVINANIAAQQAQYDAAKKAQDHYDQVYKPMEDALVAQARDYNSPERRALNMGKASATVAQTFDTQRQAAQQSLEQYGVDPTSTRYQALDLTYRGQKAAAQAAAANQAGDATEAQGMALMTNAVNIGRGYPSAISTSYNTGTNAGSAGVNSDLATTASGATTMGTAPQYYGLGSAALGGGNQALGIGNSAIGAGNGAMGNSNGALSVWGNTLNNGYGNQMAQYNANQSASSGFGSILGTAAGLAPMFLAEGGAVPHPQADVPIPNAQPTRGGAIPVHASPSRGHVTDDVPAMLNAGEFVIPRDAMQWKGEEFFQKLIQKTREDRHQNSPAQPTTRRMALPARG